MQRFSFAYLGAAWRVFGASWGDIGASWGDLEASWGDLETFWDGLRASGGDLCLPFPLPPASGQTASSNLHPPLAQLKF